MAIDPIEAAARVLAWQRFDDEKHERWLEESDRLRFVDEEWPREVTAARANIAAYLRARAEHGDAPAAALLRLAAELDRGIALNIRKLEYRDE